MLEYSEYIKIFIGLLAVIDPFGAIPIVVAVTSGSTPKQLQKIIWVVVVTVSIILFSALYLGEDLLNLFGISISSFRVAGGILLLLMGISMLHARISGMIQTEQEAQEGEGKESVAVVPLSIPLLAGPGAISTVILYAYQGSDIRHYLFMSIDICFVIIALWLVLQFTPWICRHISQTGINIVMRLMGLVIASLAVEFIANGLKGLFPVLASV